MTRAGQKQLPQARLFAVEPGADVRIVGMLAAQLVEAGQPVAGLAVGIVALARRQEQLGEVLHFRRAGWGLPGFRRGRGHGPVLMLG
jgi:hypothetical protein